MAAQSQPWVMQNSHHVSRGDLSCPNMQTCVPLSPFGTTHCGCHETPWTSSSCSGLRTRHDARNSIETHWNNDRKSSDFTPDFTPAHVSWIMATSRQVHLFCRLSRLRPFPAHVIPLRLAPRVTTSRPIPPGRKRSKGNRALSGARGVFFLFIHRSLSLHTGTTRPCSLTDARHPSFVSYPAGTLDTWSPHSIDAIAQTPSPTSSVRSR